MRVMTGVGGFDALDRELEKLKPATGKAALRRAGKTAAQPLADKMRQGAPHGENDLAESIAVSTKLSARQRGQHKRTVPDGKASVELFIGAGPLPQAHLQEFGTAHHAAQPFARPAWHQDREAMLQRLSDELWREIEKTVARAAARGTLRT